MWPADALLLSRDCDCAAQDAAPGRKRNHDGNGYPDVSVQGVMCFTKAELPLLGTLKMRGHLLLYRKALAKRLNADGPLESIAIDAIARAFVEALPSA